MVDVESQKKFDESLSVIINAFNGENGPDQVKLAVRLVEVAAQVIRKNVDYGASVWKPPLLAPTLPPKIAIQVRLSDKLARLARAFSGEGLHVKTETIEDTMLDAIGYEILWLAAPVE